MQAQDCWGKGNVLELWGNVWQPYQSEGENVPISLEGPQGAPGACEDPPWAPLVARSFNVCKLVIVTYGYTPPCNGRIAIRLESRSGLAEWVGRREDG